MRSFWGRLCTRLERLARGPRLKMGVAAGAALVLAVGLFVVVDRDDDPPVQVAIADGAQAFDGVTTTDGATPTTSVVPPSAVAATTVPGGPVTVTTTEPPSPVPAGRTEFVAAGLYPVISADGRFVAYSAASGAGPSRLDVYLRDTLTGATELVSAPEAGGAANDSSRALGISPDGRFVRFLSEADNLVAGDSDDKMDVFVLDRATRALSRTPLTPTGAEPSEDAVVMSADGRYVAFVSNDPSLFADGEFHPGQVFVSDLVAGTTTLVSHDANGKVGNWGARAPSISADGRVVAFAASAHDSPTNVDGSRDPGSAVFAVDLATDRLERISPVGDQFRHSWVPPWALSADGRWVAFAASTGAVPGHSDVFLHDRESGTTTQLTHGSFRANSGNPAVSADGRRVAFQATSAVLVAGDTNGTNDVFVIDVPTRAVRRVSVSNTGEQGNNQSSFPAITADGRAVVFSTMATNLAPGATSGSDILVSRLSD